MDMSVRKPKKGKSFGDKCLKLVPEFSEHNLPITVWDFSPNCTETFWWVCREHGEYQKTAHDRVSKGRGCPECSKSWIRETSKESSLGGVHPELVRLWSHNNTLSIFEVRPNSHKEYWFICQVHGRYLQSCARASSGKRCKWCAKQSENPYKGESLGDLYPDLAKEWSDNNELTPFDYYPHSSKEVTWTCPRGHKNYTKTIKNRTLRGHGCPKCSHRLGSPSKEDSLGYLYPKLEKDWSPSNSKTPYEVYPGSHYKAKWICKKHGDYSMSCYSRTSGHGCPECGKVEASKSRDTPLPRNSLGDLYPELIPEWSSENDRTPFDVKSGSNYRAIWACSKGHGTYVMTCKDHVRGHGCCTCGIDSISKINSTSSKEDSLGYKYPDLIKEWSPRNDKGPFEVYAGSSTKFLWVCQKGHEWVTTCYSRTGSRKTGCPHCCHNQTSNTEGLLREGLVPLGALQDQYKIGKWTVDIYIHSSKTIIEYDGSYYHNSPTSYERDTRKSLDVLAQGYKVIRVRTYSKNYILKSLEITNPNYFEIFCKEPKDSVPSEELVEEIKTILEFDKGGYLL